MFSDAAAGITAAPIRLKFPIHFQGFIPESCGGFFPFDTPKLRLESESRKTFLRKLSTGTGLAVDKVNPARQRAGFCAASAAALRQQAQAKRIQLDEALRVLLVIGPGVVLERHVRFRIERAGDLRPTTLALPLYSFSRTVPLTCCWLRSIAA